MEYHHTKTRQPVRKDKATFYIVCVCYNKGYGRWDEKSRLLDIIQFVFYARKMSRTIPFHVCKKNVKTNQVWWYRHPFCFALLLTDRRNVTVKYCTNAPLNSLVHMRYCNLHYTVSACILRETGRCGHICDFI